MTLPTPRRGAVQERAVASVFDLLPAPFCDAIAAVSEALAAPAEQAHAAAASTAAAAQAGQEQGGCADLGADSGGDGLEVRKPAGAPARDRKSGRARTTCI